MKTTAQQAARVRNMRAVRNADLGRKIEQQLSQMNSFHGRVDIAAAAVASADEMAAFVGASPGLRGKLLRIQQELRDISKAVNGVY